MSQPQPSLPPSDLAPLHEAIDRLAAQLARMGAETARERKVKRVVPWVISLLLHVGVGVLALLITWTVSQLPKKDESVLIVADFNAMNYEPVAGFDSPTTEVTGPSVRENVTPAPTNDQLSAQLLSATGDPLAEFTDLGSLMKPLAGGSALNQFAPKAGANAATFAGVRGSNARRIVYAIDASGSMVAHLQLVVQELDRSLQGLSPQQSFSVIFFQGMEAVELPPAGGLLPATAEERGKALRWIAGNVVPAGGTNPLVAIEKALALKPDVIFLLSQNITGYGQFEVDQRELMALLEGLNPKAANGRRMTQINCIQFVEEDPLGTMRKIAEEHGGPNGYKFLDRAELGLGGG